jgi:hypothetical protein
MKLYEGKVYALVSKETEMIYIGSTTRTLGKRFAGHKSDMKRGNNCSSIEMLKYPDCDIHLLDRLYVTKSKNDPELLKLEGKYQLINKDICVNKQVSRGMTHKENCERYNRLPKAKEQKRKYQQSDRGKELDRKFRLSEKNIQTQKRYLIKMKKYKQEYNHFRHTSFFGQLCKMYKIYN